MSTIRLLPIAASRFRHQVELDGVLDGINRDFTIPNGEKAAHTANGIKILAYHNTRRLNEDEFQALESEGPGTGFDTIRIIAFAPPATSLVFVDFITA